MLSLFKFNDEALLNRLNAEVIVFIFILSYVFI
jgi:hypothetical protein